MSYTVLSVADTLPLSRFDVRNETNLSVTTLEPEGVGPTGGPRAGPHSRTLVFLNQAYWNKTGRIAPSARRTRRACGLKGQPAAARRVPGSCRFIETARVSTIGHFPAVTGLVTGSRSSAGCSQRTRAGGSQ